MIEKTFPITEKLLNNALQNLEKLQELLNKEAEHLGKCTDPIVLSVIVEKKREQIINLEKFTDHLGQVLATENLLANQDGVKQYFNKAQVNGINTTASQQCWDTISERSKFCRQLNEQNGACIDLLNRHTQRAIQILKGKPQATHTYGPDGKSRDELFSRPLISV